MALEESDLIDVDSLFEDNPNGMCFYGDWQRELNLYCAEGRADKSTNILEWWRSHKTTYPNLARMARDYLCLPATSVPSERLFSRGSLTIRKHRNQLSDNSIRF